MTDSTDSRAAMTPMFATSTYSAWTVPPIFFFTTDTQSWPPGWDPPGAPPPLSEQLVIAFIGLHKSAVSLKEAWS